MFRMILVAVACTLLLTFSDAHAETPIIVQSSLIENNFSSVPIYVMKDKKLDLANGVDLQIRMYANIEGAYQAMRVGQTEFAPAGWTNVVQWRSTGFPWQIVYPLAKGQIDVLVPTNSNIKSMEDLKGKKIGSYAGPTGTATMLLRTLLTNYYGFDPAKTNNLQYGGPPILINALKRGEIDALVMLDPLSTKLIASGEAKSLTNLTTAYEAKSGRRMMWLAWVAHESLIRRAPEAVSKLLRAYQQSLAYLKSHPEEWKRYSQMSGVEDTALPMLIARTESDLDVDWSQQWIDDLTAFVAQSSEILGSDVMPRTVPEGTFSLEFKPAAQ